MKTVGRDIESLQSPCLRHNFNFPEDSFLEAKTWTIFLFHPFFDYMIFVGYFYSFPNKFTLKKLHLGTFSTKNIPKLIKCCVNFSKIILGTFPTKSILYMLMI